MSLAKRARDILHRLFYSKSRSVSLSSRVLALAVVMLTITSVFPTLAEESSTTPSPAQSPAALPTPDPSPSPSSTESPEASPTPSPSPSSTESDAQETSAPEDDEASPTPSPSATVEEIKIEPTEFQPQIAFRVPVSLAVDPRAWIAQLPQLNLSGGSVGMLCLSSNSIIDLGNKNYSNDFESEENLVIGDTSNFVRVVGSMGFINAMINMDGGIRLTSFQGGVSASGLGLRYVELNGIDASAEFCGQSTNQRGIYFRALGLRIDTVKTQVKMNKPSGR